MIRSQNTQYCRTPGKGGNCLSKTCKDAMSRFRIWRDLQKSKVAVLRLSRMALNTSGSTHAASIRKAVLSYLKLSTKCIRGIRTSKYATPTWLMCPVQRIRNPRLLHSRKADGLREDGPFRNFLRLRFSNSMEKIELRLARSRACRKKSLESLVSISKP